MSLRRFALIAVGFLLTAGAVGGCTNTPSSKISVGVVAYVRPGDPLFQMLMDPAVEPPEYVVVNMDHGDGDMTPMDGVADFLHLRTTKDGKRVKVLGYVWTSVIEQPEINDDWTKYDYSKRPEADIRAGVDRWLVRANGVQHYDGIFFDIASPVCKHHDKFLRLRDHVRSRLPGGMIVHNAGMPVESCYVLPGQQTADVFGTFEGAESIWFKNPPEKNPPTDCECWIGGNLRHNGEWIPGDTVDGVAISPNIYWHLVYGGTPGREQQAVDLARARGVGNLTVSTAPGGPGVNPWIKGPGEPAHLQALVRAAKAPATAPVG